MLIGPVHYPHHLVPVIYLFEFEMFNGRTRDYQAVKLVMGNVIKSLVERVEMLSGCILRKVHAGVYQGDLHLQGCIGKEPQYLRFRRDLNWHKVEDQYLQGPDILMNRPGLLHNEYVLVFKDPDCRKII